MMYITRRYKLIAVCLIVLIVFASLLHSLSGHGYIDINVVNSKNPVKVVMTNQQSGEITQGRTVNGHYKKLLKTANYSIYIHEQTRNDLTVAKVNGFFSKKHVDVNLSSEVGRSFIGDNPAPCQYFLNGELFSYECSSSGGVYRHAAATAATPTYTELTPVVSKFEKVVGVVKTKQGNVLLTQVQDPDSGAGILYASLTTDLITKTSTVPLNGVDGSANYYLAPYSDGFILYTSDLSSVLYFANITANPEPVVTKPTDKLLFGQTITANQQGLVAVYSSSDGSDAQSKSTQKSEIVVITGKKQNSYPLSGLVSKAALCGTNICVLSGDVMTTYSVQKNTLVPVYQIRGVSDIKTTNNVVYVVTKVGITELTNGALPTHYEYIFGLYSYCGVSTSSESLVVCLISPRQSKVALLLSGVLSDYPIDASVAELSKDKTVAGVSAYKNFVYLTPEAGQMDYNAETNQYKYSDSQIKNSQQLVTTSITKAKLDTTQYTVINTVTY